MTIKEQVAETIFPFSLYASGTFNHADIINAMVTMAELFEGLYGQAFIRANEVKQIEHQTMEQ